MYKYLVIQAICFLFDVLLFSFFIYIKFDIFYSNLASKIISGILSYIMIGLFVFNSGNYLSIVTISKYFALWILNIFFSSYFVVLLNSFVGVAVLSKIIVDVIMFNLNFFISKYFVFKVK